MLYIKAIKRGRRSISGGFTVNVTRAPAALGLTVEWTAEAGVLIPTKPLRPGRPAIVRSPASTFCLYSVRFAGTIGKLKSCS